MVVAVLMVTVVPVEKAVKFIVLTSKVVAVQEDSAVLLAPYLEEVEVATVELMALDPVEDVVLDLAAVTEAVQVVMAVALVEVLVVAAPEAAVAMEKVAMREAAVAMEVAVVVVTAMEVVAKAAMTMEEVDVMVLVQVEREGRSQQLVPLLRQVQVAVAMVNKL